VVGQTVAVVGLGQIGSELASGLRAAGAEVVDVHRDELDRLGGIEADAVVLAVPEDALVDVAGRLPPRLRDRAVLVQNELVAASWRDAGLVSPTVAVVWFERKGGKAPRPILTTPVAGPHAALIVDALARRSIPAEAIDAGAPLARALAAKNLYIVTSNLAGLAASRSGRVHAASDVVWPTAAATMGDLLGAHLAFARALAAEVFAIELARVDAADREALGFDEAWTIVERATKADPEHGCAGRSAPARLARAQVRAVALGVDAPIIGALATHA
jgi:hypothetical protein